MKKNLFVTFILTFVIAMFCGCNIVRERDSENPSTSFETTNSVSSEIVSSTKPDSNSYDLKLKRDCDPYMHTVSAEEYIEEFPDFGTSYLEAELPEDLQNFLNTDGQFALITEDNLVLVDFRYYDFFGYSTNYFADITSNNSGTQEIGRPIIYYDNKKLYIEGFTFFDIFNERRLVRYCLNDDTFETITSNVDVLNVEGNFKIIDYYYIYDATLVYNEDDSFSLYRLGENSFTFKVNADPNIFDILNPFIDRDNNLCQLKIDPYNLENSQLIVIDTDVKNVSEDAFYEFVSKTPISSYICRLYQRYDDSYFIYGYNFQPFSYYYSINPSLSLDEVFTDVELRVKKSDAGYGNCFLHIGNINIPNSVFIELDTDIHLLLTDSELSDENLNEFFYNPFKFSESSEKIEELLTYIKN